LALIQEPNRAMGHYIGGNGGGSFMSGFPWWIVEVALPALLLIVLVALLLRPRKGADDN